MTVYKWVHYITFVSALHVVVSVSLLLCVTLCLSLIKGLTETALFCRLTYTNVLMDRGDIENEGEERGNEE